MISSIFLEMAFKRDIPALTLLFAVEVIETLKFACEQQHSRTSEDVWGAGESGHFGESGRVSQKARFQQSHIARTLKFLSSAIHLKDSSLDYRATLRRGDCLKRICRLIKFGDDVPSSAHFSPPHLSMALAASGSDATIHYHSIKSFIPPLSKSATLIRRPP
uniref:hypothetical protein n=1 Tax=Neorhizobium sp. EC2-8 TaxID=3129230 RepID=UPI003100F820